MSPIGQLKDDLELRIGIVKDFQLSSQSISVGPGMSGRSKFKSTTSLWDKSAETCRAAGF